MMMMLMVYHTTDRHQYKSEFACLTCVDFASQETNANFITPLHAGFMPQADAEMEAIVDGFMLLKPQLNPQRPKQSLDTLAEPPDNADVPLLVSATNLLPWYPLPHPLCQRFVNPLIRKNEIFGPPRLWAQDMCVLVHERDGRAPINLHRHYRWWEWETHSGVWLNCLAVTSTRAVCRLN